MLPVPQPDRDLLLVVAGVALWLACAAAGLAFMRRRVTGALLGPWLGYAFGGVIFGVVVSLIAIPLEGLRGDLWPFMSGYMRIADGASFGVAAGLICAPLTWVFTARRRGARSGNTGRAIESPRRSPFAAITSALLACLLVATLITPTVQSMTPPSPATAPPDMLRVSDGRITDGVGNQILLRGVNVNQLVDFYAYDPEQPVTTPFTRGDVDAIAS